MRRSDSELALTSYDNLSTSVGASRTERPDEGPESWLREWTAASAHPQVIASVRRG